SVVYHVILADGQVAGSLVSWEVDGDREVGYWLGRQFWGKGIATEALRQFLGVVHTRHLVAHVAKHNIGSRRVLEKNGFKVIREDSYNSPAGDVVEEYLLKLDR